MLALTPHLRGNPTSKLLEVTRIGQYRYEVRPRPILEGVDLCDDRVLAFRARAEQGLRLSSIYRRYGADELSAFPEIIQLLHARGHRPTGDTDAHA
jgi:hypothetical protein